MDPSQLLNEPFPATSKNASGQVDGVSTEATALFFSDKILVTLCQEGRLSQWVGFQKTKDITRRKATSLNKIFRFKYLYPRHRPQP